MSQVRTLHRANVPGKIADRLREQLYRTPFRPVTLHLPSGKALAIGNPGLAMFNETGRTLIVGQGEHVFLIDVTTVEAVETAAE